MRKHFSTKPTADAPQGYTVPVAEADGGEIHLGYLASLFIAFGLLGLITAWVLDRTDVTFHDKAVTRSSPLPDEKEALEPGETSPSQNYALIGPFWIDRAGRVVKVSLATRLPADTWSFIEGELLDDEQDYLMSFGSEVWHETGSDSDGPWQESDNGYEIKLTMPEAGRYFINLRTQGHTPDQIALSVVQTIGSSIPHMVFGYLCLAIGLILNEIANRTVIGLLGRFT